MISSVKQSGEIDGLSLGNCEADADGNKEGFDDIVMVGNMVGNMLGTSLGNDDGFLLGTLLGAKDGMTDGLIVGVRLGTALGHVVGIELGSVLGDSSHTPGLASLTPTALSLTIQISGENIGICV